jgi:release factor glutamine methyltransferase
MTLGEVLDQGACALFENGIDNARLEAEVLLRHSLALDAVALYINLQERISSDQIHDFFALVKRRINHEPTAYITGNKEFFGLDFYVCSPVLIPRPETEILVEKTIEISNELFTDSCLIADVGTGCGAIAVSLAVNLCHARIYAVDVSSAALDIARKNCHSHGVADRVTLLQGNLLNPLPEPVHLIVANLPYVRESELGELSTEISKFEPVLALNGGTDGLVTIGGLISQAGRNLLPGGVVLLEIGPYQGQAVYKLASMHLPESEVSIAKDLCGLDRVVSIRTSS